MFRGWSGHILQIKLGKNLYKPLHCDALIKRYVLHLGLWRNSNSPNTKWRDTAKTAIRLQKGRTNFIAMNVCFSKHQKTSDRLNRRTVLNIVTMTWAKQRPFRNNMPISVKAFDPAFSHTYELKEKGNLFFPAFPKKGKSLKISIFKSSWKQSLIDLMSRTKVSKDARATDVPNETCDQ